MKLRGLRVIDLSVFLPGPYLTLALADHGAEVIKVEQPGEGDPGRHIGLADGAHTVFFRNLNRGKKSVVLDLKTEPDRAALLTLVDSADVFVESFRPGVVDRLGVGYEALRARNPRLVYCSISAFGQDGPLRSRPAHELAVEAMAGVLSLGVDAGGAPVLPAAPWGDLLSGLQGLAGVLMALLRREQTGQGDHVDIAMLDATFGALVNAMGPSFAEGRQPVPQHERTTGGSAFYRLYATRDGRHIALAGQEPKFIHALLAALGRPELAPLCLRGPGPHQQPVMDFLAAEFARHTRDEWEPRLAALDVCFGGVNTLHEALAQTRTAEQLRARGMLQNDAQGHPHIGSPIRFRHEPARPSFDTPALGQHAPLIQEIQP